MKSLDANILQAFEWILRNNGYEVSGPNKDLTFFGIFGRLHFVIYLIIPCNGVEFQKNSCSGFEDIKFQYFLKSVPNLFLRPE